MVLFKRQQVEMRKRMGYGIKNALERISCCTNLNPEAENALIRMGNDFDDDTWEEFNFSRKRKNYIGAHMWKTQNAIAKRCHKKHVKTVRRWITEWIDKNWVTLAKEVKALDDNTTYKIHMGNRYSDKEQDKQKHLVLNVSKLCRMLDILETIEYFKLEDNLSAEEAYDITDSLYALAWTDYPLDYEQPPCSDINDYVPGVLLEYEKYLQNGAPENWSDAITIMEKGDGQKTTAKKVQEKSKSKNQGGNTSVSQELSYSDNSIDKEEYEKLEQELFPRSFVISRKNGENVTIEFTPQHINDNGELDIYRLQIDDDVIDDFYEDTVFKEVHYYNTYNHDDLLRMRQYLDAQQD